MILSDVKEYVHSFKNKKIAVIGDMMLDHYLWGSVDRISPEAPVPVIDVKREEYRLGGAANVVRNLTELQAIPLVFGVYGEGIHGNILLNLLTQNNVSTDYLICDPQRSTTVKTRIMASHQQIARLDFEKKDDINSDIENEIIQKFQECLADIDAIIIEDYNKGLLTATLIENVIRLANQNHIPITVDPKYKNFFKYTNCTVFKPNFIELQKNMGTEIGSDEEFQTICKELIDRIHCEYLMITRGEKGLVVFDREMNEYIIPTFAKEVFDVSGAGDTVISVLTLCLSVGCDIKTAAIIANHAAGAVCGKMGIAPATAKDIFLSFEYNDLISKGISQ